MIKASDLLESLRAKTNRPRLDPGACGLRTHFDGASNRLPDLHLPGQTLTASQHGR